ncbi:BPTI/Kunitz domain-containing protein [Rhincodon typus]|uniref:BPTI/Kunitz domain-containing protein n=1 Tax=Rhincodon typus TaxID=259920 RepID=UPI00202F6850|nr:BPTI/Kunitz domain-containing protein [Rhincodon typus]
MANIDFFTGYMGLLAVHFVAFAVGQRPLACNLPMDEGQIGDSPSVKFYYNQTSDRCKIFAYRGAGGNANRFFTDEHCMRNCSSLADDIYPNDAQACLLPKDPGDCKGRLLLYYFDNAKKKCKTFLYGGCGGNGNRFFFLSACNSHCASKMGGPPVQDDDESEVNEGLAVGLGMGCAVLLTLAVALAVFFTQRKKRVKKLARKSHEEPLNKGIEMR